MSRKLKFFSLFYLISLTFLIYLKFLSLPLAVIVPHHDLVKSTRTEFLTQIKKQRPNIDTIIIIGPDHFSQNQKGIYYTDRNWNLTTGTYAFAASLNPHLSPHLTLKDSLFTDDHAIYNVLPDLHQNWPSSQIFPILVGQQYPLSDLNTLITQISRSCTTRCLLVASVDFSHYLPALLAHIHDLTSLRVLHNLEIDHINSLEVDSPQSLYILSNFAAAMSARNFNLFAHTNSGFIFQNPETETTTHLFASYSRSLLPPKPLTLSTFSYIPPQVNRSQNQTTLGDRTFYGTDSNQYVQLPGLPATPPPGFIVAGYQTPSCTSLSFFPLNSTDPVTTFSRHPDSVAAVSTLFDSLDQISPRYKNYFWSTINYDCH